MAKKKEYTLVPSSPQKTTGMNYQQQQFGSAPYPQGQYQAGAPPPPGFVAYPPPHPAAFVPLSNAHYAESQPVDTDGKYSMQFSDRTIRMAFIRKVFSLVFIMLAVVAIMTAIPFFHPQTRQMVRANMGIYYLGYIVFFVVYMVLICCESVRRSFPMNLILTAIFTLAIGFMSMVITAHHNLDTVMLALIITTFCCGSVIIFASQTKYDITAKMGIIFILSMCLMFFGLVAIIGTMFFKIPFIHTIYALLSAIMFMVYLAVDIQMLMGGKKLELSPEDHIFAAVQIFIDIVFLFWTILSLVGGSRD